MWRYTTLLFRNKSAVFASFVKYVLIALTLAILFKYALPTAQYSASQGLEYAYVVSSDPADSSNGDLQSELKLGNCTNSQKMFIGLVINPDNDQTTTVLQGVYDDITDAVFKFTNDQPFTSLTFESFEDLDDYVMQRDYFAKELCFAMGFDTFDTVTNDYSVQIRFPISSLPPNDADQTQNEQVLFDVAGQQLYQSSGFMNVMSSVTQNIIQLIDTPSPQTETSFSVSFIAMPTEEFEFQVSLKLTGVLLSILFMQTQFFGGRLRSIITEKHEEKVEWIKTLMGYKKSIAFMEDAIQYFIPQLFLVPIYCIFVSYLLIPSIGYPIFLVFSALFVVENFCLYAVLRYALGSFGLVLFALIAAFQMLMNVLLNVGASFNPEVQLMTSFLPLQQLNIMINLGLFGEIQGKSINFSTWDVPILTIQPMLVFFIALGEAVFLVLLLIYLWPLRINNDPENPLKWYYPFTCGCCRGKKQVNIKKGKQENELQANLQIENNLLPEENLMVEQGTVELPNIVLDKPTDALRIRNLVKRYPGSTNPSIDQLSLSTFKNELLVLLGHNGAGKTTTISCLTGLTKPSSGLATAFGIDIFNNFGEIQDFVGVCPQEDILLEKMSVAENVKYFGAFKGLTPEQIDKETNHLTEKFGIQNKKDSLAGQLSGGQKRKLQLIIAMLGDSRIVLLDEPSSGMDPSSRNDTWDVIKEFKQDRIIILTTHYMDEAEMLADRVAIMSKGKLVCCGSSLFLKQKYGKGFYLEIEKAQDTESLEQLEKVLCDQIQEYQIDSKVAENGTIDYTIPPQSAQSFDSLFQHIDSNLESLNIKRYNLRVASLEEVFLQIGQDESVRANHDQVQSPQQQEGKITKTSELNINEMLEDRSSFMPLLKQNLKRKWYGGSFFCAFVSIPILVFLAFAVPLMAGVLLPSVTINYSQPQQVLNQDALPMPTPINKNTLDSNSQSTQEFFSLIENNESQVFKFEEVEVNQVSSDDQEAINSTLSQFNSQESTYSPQNMYFGSYLLYSYDLTNVNLYTYSNTSSQAGMPIYGAAAFQAIARYQTQTPDLNLQFVNAPLPQNVVVAQSTNRQVPAGMSNTSVFMFIALSFIIGNSYMYNFDNGYYTQLLMSGASEGTIFLSNYIVDLGIMVYYSVVLYGLLTAFGFYLQNLWVPLILFCLVFPIYIYSLCYLFVTSKAITTGLAMFTTAQLIPVLLAANLAFDGNWSVYMLMHFLVCLLPSGNFTFAMMDIMLAPTRSLQKKGTTEVNTLGSDGCLIPMAFLAMNFVFYSMLLVCLIKCRFKRPQGVTDVQPEKLSELEKLKVDQGVSLEAERINKDAKSQEDVLTVQNLVKYYYKKEENEPVATVDRTDHEDLSKEQQSTGQKDQKKQVAKKSKFRKTAVKGVSFGVRPGEVFALLGVNGAGKSSTFNCMMGKETISGGQIRLNNLDMRQLLGKPYLLHNSLGYCPQTNCFAGILTVFDQLVVIARLRGVKEQYVSQYVNETIDRFALSDFRHTRANNLSGGNKRKVCCAMAVIAQPKVVFIDEASAGVDPMSRRQMWKGIKHDTKNSATVITTHAMEEAEALASKISIMVAGRLNCMGTKQELKNTYGQGYEIKFSLDILKYIQSLTGDDIYKSAELSINRTQNTIDNNKQSIVVKNNYQESEIQKHLQEWQDELKAKDKPIVIDFVKEFSKDGMLGKDYKKAIQLKEKISLDQLKKDVLTYNLVMILCQKMTTDVAHTTVDQVDHSTVQFRMENNGKSIGSMFAYVEQLKEQFCIREYSIQQSNLEQIFNLFAKADASNQFNKRLTQPSIDQKKNTV